MKRVFVVDEDEECDASPNVGAELLPLSPSARRIPSALECVLSSMSNTYVVNSDIDNYDNNSSNNINNKNTNKNNPVLSLEERWAALAQSLSLPLAEAQWPPPPPPGGSLLFAPPLLQRKRKTQLHTPKKMKMRNLQEQQQEQDEEEDDEMAELRNGEKLEGAWVPWGEGRLRSNDGRLHFSLRASELPAACCREAFPCSSDFAPCVPVGHRALGTLRVAQLAARRSDCESMLMQTSIISGGCRPRFCVLITSGDRVVVELRHSQPGRLLEIAMQQVLRERWNPHSIPDSTASVFFGLRVDRVWKQLEYANSVRRK